MTRVVVQEILQAATAKHNDFVKAKNKTMKTQRTRLPTPLRMDFVKLGLEWQK
jgi:hypothetical protein